MTAINNASDVALGTVPATLRVLPVVIAGKHGTFWLFHLRIGSLQTVEETMTRMHQLLDSEEYRRSPAGPRGHLANTFVKESIHKADISTVGGPNGDPEAATLPREVIVSVHEYSPELTAFFRRPALSKNCGCFADRFPDVLFDATQTHYILISQEMSKTAVGIAAAMMIAFWLLLSALIGVIRKNMEAGFTVAGVGIGVMALFVAVVKGIQK